MYSGYAFESGVSGVTYLDEGNDEAACGLVQLLVVPGGVLGSQDVAAPVVLSDEQVVERRQAQVLVASGV